MAGAIPTCCRSSQVSSRRRPFSRNSVIMAGVTGPVAPSGGLNPGIVSVSGQRETANGFYVNGGDVQERMNGGTGVVPNLDSIEEFRLLTNNFDPRVRQLQRRHRQRRHQIGQRQLSREPVRVLPQHEPRRPQLLLARARRVQAEPARRHDRRSAQARQDLLLRRLSGDANDAGHRDREHLGAVAAESCRQFLRHRRLA